MNWKEEWKLHNGEGEVPKWFSELIMSMEESYAHSTENGYCCACPYDIACLEEEVKHSQQQLLERLSEGVEKFINEGVDNNGWKYQSTDTMKAFEEVKALIQEEKAKL